MPDRFGKKNGPSWRTWSHLARDFVGVVHAALKEAMKSAENQKQPISVTHLQHEFGVAMPDASSGTLAEKYGGFHESREVGTSGCVRLTPARWQRGRQRYQRRKRSITCAEVRTGNFGTMTSPLAHLGRSSRDVSSWKVGRVALERRAVRALAARQSHPTALGKFLTSVKEHRLQLDEGVEVNDARVVYPNEYFVLEVQHHHGSQLLAAVMDSLDLGPTDRRGIFLI